MSGPHGPYAEPWRTSTTAAMRAVSTSVMRGAALLAAASADASAASVALGAPALEQAPSTEQVLSPQGNSWTRHAGTTTIDLRRSRTWVLHIACTACTAHTEALRQAPLACLEACGARYFTRLNVTYMHVVLYARQAPGSSAGWQGCPKRGPYHCR